MTAAAAYVCPEGILEGTADSIGLVCASMLPRSLRAFSLGYLTAGLLSRFDFLVLSLPEETPR